MKESAYVTLSSAAKSLGISPNTLRNWDKSGKLKATRHPKNGYRFYKIKDVIGLLREQGELYLTDVEPRPEDPRVLKRVFRQLSREFRNSCGGGLLERFEEISKLLFCKISDERTRNGGSQFVVRPGESIEKAYGRISLFYARVSKKYPGVFTNGRRGLSTDKPAVVRSVQILQGLQLSSAPGDVKGAAYEELIRNTFEKTEHQQFFTPRQIVRFMVEFAEPSPDWRICDPACGSGGFLIETLHFLVGKQKAANDRRKPQVTGAEVDERMAWVAQMNLQMHGDGVGKIHHLPIGGSLSMKETSLKVLPDNHFDLVLTNPPFGSDFSDRTELNSYETGRGRSSRRRGVLFVERCIRMLRPGGLLGIILDDSILSGPANRDIRRLIFRRATVEAIISLPDVTFMPYASAKASIIFLRKGVGGSNEKHDIFMARVENVGHRPNGDPLYSEERDANGRRMLLTDLPLVLADWRRYRRSGRNLPLRAAERSFICPKHHFFNPANALIDDRLDVLYHHPSRMFAESILSKSIFPMPCLGEIAVERCVSVIPNVSQPDEVIRYIGLANLTARTGEYEVTEELGDRIKSAVRLFRGGDIVFSKLRPELRKCAFILEDEEDGFISSECVVLRGLDKAGQDPDFQQRLQEARARRVYEVDSEYLAHMLRSDIVFGQLVYQCTGVGRPRVSKPTLLNVRVPLPPIAVQRKLVAVFRRARDQYGLYRKQSRESLVAGHEALEKAYALAQASLCPNGIAVRGTESRGVPKGDEHPRAV